MQRICNKYANICIEYAQNMQKIYAKICKNMQFICKNMQIYAAQFVPQKYAKICKNMQSICMLYAKTCKICNHVFYMQNMQKYALPTLLMLRIDRVSCVLPVTVSIICATVYDPAAARAYLCVYTICVNHLETCTRAISRLIPGYPGISPGPTLGYPFLTWDNFQKKSYPGISQNKIGS